jgi:hypothetical protein
MKNLTENRSISVTLTHHAPLSNLERAGVRLLKVLRAFSLFSGAKNTYFFVF